MKLANALVLAGSAVSASLALGLTLRWDAGAGVSAALLGGLGAMMLGGWLSASLRPTQS